MRIDLIKQSAGSRTFGCNHYSLKPVDLAARGDMYKEYLKTKRFKIYSDHSWKVPYRFLGHTFYIKARAYRFTWGKGAGYIGGFTAYLVILGTTWRDRHKRVLFQLGVTRSCNRIPYVIH